MANRLDFSIDPDIERAFDWLVSFLPRGQWAARKSAVEAHVESLLAPSADSAKLHRLVGDNDQIAWYLYLVETSQHEPYRSEIHQSSRILPIFKRLGTDLEKLLVIGGIEAQADKLLNASKSQPDSVLFEMLIALLWAKNGWEDVSFIPASKTERKPDIHASNGTKEWFIEAKRLTTSSAYSQRERDKWLRMWNPFKNILVTNSYPFILDITFHVELETLPDSFFVDQLEAKLNKVASPCLLISNATWDVSVAFVDFHRIQTHLKAQQVKSQSRQLQELIGGSWERGKGFTYVMAASEVRIGGHRGVNKYVDDIKWAACAYRRCDAPQAIKAKARDIRTHLSDAVSQLPSSGRSVVHIGMETSDGEDVEAERFAKIARTAMSFDARGKDLRFIYTHLFESYSPPDGPWVLDETIYKFGANAVDNPEPLSLHHAVTPAVEGDDDGFHWLCDPL